MSRINLMLYLRLKLNDSLPNFFVFNVVKYFGNCTIFWDSVKLACDSTFVDALGPSDSVKSNLNPILIYC